MANDIVVNPEIIKHLTYAYNNPDFGQDDLIDLGRNLAAIYGHDETYAALDAFCAAVSHVGAVN